MPKKIQCKDIPESPILEFLLERRFRGKGSAVWYVGYENSIPRPEGIPDRLMIAKMGQMIRKGIVEGCDCGCRGDYDITDEGVTYLLKINHLLPQ